MSKQAFHAVIAGVGPGIGRAVAMRFASVYPVVLLARRSTSYEGIVQEIEAAGGRAVGIATDVRDAASLNRAFDSVQSALPGSQLAAAVFNVNIGFGMKPFLELTYQEFESSLGGITESFFNFSQATIPLLLQTTQSSPNPPTLIVTGATASLKASAKFSSFAAGRFALRAMTQSLAREFGPQGVHIAHAVIDGLVDTPATKAMDSSNPEGKLDPEAVAETYWHLHTQRRSAFTHEIDLRPYSETF